MAQAKILTVSDSVAAGRVEDTSGTRLAELLERAEITVTERRAVADGVDEVAVALGELCSGFAGIVVTTGGTGFGPRDLTPEGTKQVLERDAPGLAEAMRAVSPKGRLGRGLAGSIGQALVVNLPGSPAGATESLEAILDVVPHILELLAGGNPHPHGHHHHR